MIYLFLITEYSIGYGSYAYETENRNIWIPTDLYTTENWRNLNFPHFPHFLQFKISLWLVDTNGFERNFPLLPQIFIYVWKNMYEQIHIFLSTSPNLFKLKFSVS